jgi:hypothetical protein
VDLGGTLGNVKVSVAYEKAEIKADQTGTTPLDRRVSGAKFSVETMIAQIQDLTIMAYVFPSASAIGGAAAASAIQFQNQVGKSDIATAGRLRLHPQSQGAATAHDWVFFKAAPTEASEVTYGPTEQSALKVNWGVYPDTSVTPYKFMQYGQQDIG